MEKIRWIESKIHYADLLGKSGKTLCGIDLPENRNEIDSGFKEDIEACLKNGDYCLKCQEMVEKIFMN